MLTFKLSNQTISPDARAVQWHTGEPWPALSGRVISIQADGDELGLILSLLSPYVAMRANEKAAGFCVGARVMYCGGAGLPELLGTVVRVGEKTVSVRWDKWPRSVMHYKPRNLRHADSGEKLEVERGA